MTDCYDGLQHYTVCHKREPIDIALCLKHEKTRRAFNKRVCKYIEKEWVAGRCSKRIKIKTSNMKKCKKNSLNRIAREYEDISLKMFRQKCKNYNGY